MAGASAIHKAETIKTAVIAEARRLQRTHNYTSSQIHRKSHNYNKKGEQQEKGRNLELLWGKAIDKIGS